MSKENEKITIQSIFDKGIDIISNTGEKAKKALDWMNENPQATLSIVGSIALLLRASQSLVVSQRVYSERNRSDRTFYDRHTGYRWQLRRKMNNNDLAIINRRRKDGDDMYDILYDLRLI